MARKTHDPYYKYVVALQVICEYIGEKDISVKDDTLENFFAKVIKNYLSADNKKLSEKLIDFQHYVCRNNKGDSDDGYTSIRRKELILMKEAQQNKQYGYIGDDCDDDY